MANNIFLPPTLVIPKVLTITAVTQSYPMIVTVLESNVYVVGQSLYFNIPTAYGMFELNQLTGTILQISGQNFYMSINSTIFDPFVIPVNAKQTATVSPSGSNNLQYNNLTDLVPFQNLNNIGN